MYLRRGLLHVLWQVAYMYLASWVHVPGHVVTTKHLLASLPATTGCLMDASMRLHYSANKSEDFPKSSIGRSLFPNTVTGAPIKLIRTNYWEINNSSE